MVYRHVHCWYLLLPVCQVSWPPYQHFQPNHGQCQAISKAGAFTEQRFAWSKASSMLKTLHQVIKKPWTSKEACGWSYPVAQEVSKHRFLLTVWPQYVRPHLTSLVTDWPHQLTIWSKSGYSLTAATYNLTTSTYNLVKVWLVWPHQLTIGSKSG